MTKTMLANAHWGPLTFVIGDQAVTIPGRRQPNGVGGHAEFKFGYKDGIDKEAWDEFKEGPGKSLDAIANGVVYELKQHDQLALRTRDAKGGRPTPIAHPDPRSGQVRPMGHVGSDPNPHKFPV